MTTKAERNKLWNDLSRNIDIWQKMDEVTLFAETKKIVPILTQATRDECLKLLIMTHTERMI